MKPFASGLNGGLRFFDFLRGWCGPNDTEGGKTSWADIDGDGIVGGGDLGLLLVAWGSSNPEADLNGNGLVDGPDLGLLLVAWGT